MGIPFVMEERFDAFSLVRYIKNTGRAYQRQAIELVNICRIFVKTSPQDKRYGAILKLTMSTAEEALRSATEAGKRITDKASGTFQEAEKRLLQYRTTVHPRLQAMDDIIIEGMARARERDEQSLRYFNQIRERRGPNVACSHIAEFPSETCYAPSASAPPSAPPPTHVGVEGGQLSPVDTQCSPRALTHQDAMAPTLQKRTTPDSCSTITNSKPAALPAFVLPESLETRVHGSSSTTDPSAISQPSCEFTKPLDIEQTTVQELLECQSSPPSNNLVQHLPSSPHSPSPSTHTDQPSNTVGVAPTTEHGHENGTIQPSRAQLTVPSNLLPRSEEKKTSSTQSQSKINTSLTRGVISPKPTAKFAPASIPLSSPKTRQASRLLMPGAFPGITVDVDISSWVLVGPVSPSAEVSNPSWFRRLFALLG